jgi:penicillin-insensitive murein endopeptidase
LTCLGGVVVVLGIVSWIGGWSSDRPSTCFGSSSHGALRDAWKLPRDGGNFRAYSNLGWLAGRTFVHSAVRETVLGAYRQLEVSNPEYRFVYGETGFATGGSFKPHRTHQNGLSVDFMVPVRDAAGTIVEIPTSVTQKFGYSLEFDGTGKLGDLQIDFEAIALHLAELKKSAMRQHVGFARVIFDPKLRERLTRTRAWSDIKDLPFMAKPAWVRHDEHYHVDFDVPCRRLADFT